MNRNFMKSELAFASCSINEEKDYYEDENGKEAYRALRQARRCEQFAFRLKAINNSEGGFNDSRIGRQRGDKASYTFTQHYMGP